MAKGENMYILSIFTFLILNTVVYLALHYYSSNKYFFKHMSINNFLNKKTNKVIKKAWKINFPISEPDSSC